MISEGPARSGDKPETRFDGRTECAAQRVMGKGSPYSENNTAHGLNPDACSFCLQSFCHKKKKFSSELLGFLCDVDRLWRSEQKIHEFHGIDYK